MPAVCMLVFAVFTRTNRRCLGPCLRDLTCEFAHLNAAGILFVKFYHRIPPRPSSVSLTQILSRYTLAVFYYSAGFLCLHRIWFNVYCLVPDVNDSDLENAPTSGRLCWTETVQKMKRVWTLIIMASSLIIT